jgi:hypothetical protein
VKTTLAALPLLLAASLASASPTYVGFDTGPKGWLNVYTTTVQGVQVDAIGGTLYRWSDCYVDTLHCDRGFGLWDGGLWNEALPELNRGEWLRLTAPIGWQVTAVWFSSVNDPGAVQVYGGIYPAGAHTLFTAADTDDAHIGRLVVKPTSQAWVTTSSEGFYFNVMGVEIDQPPTVDPQCTGDCGTTVPEPASLLLLGAGLLAFGRQRIRWER